MRVQAIVVVGEFLSHWPKVEWRSAMFVFLKTILWFNRKCVRALVPRNTFKME